MNYEEKIDQLNNSLSSLESEKSDIIKSAVTQGLRTDVEFKDSGIGYLGFLPVHWEVMPNKYIMKKLKRICDVYNGEDIISLSMNGVIVRDLDAGGKMPTSFDGYQFVYPGNLLMCLFDYDVTPRCIGYINNYGVTSPAYSQFEMLGGNYAPFYYYYYLMMDNTKELLHLAKNLRHSFSEEEFGRILAIVPPIEEQKEIAEYLNKKCAEIDDVIGDIKNQIEALRQAKKSLVIETITRGLNPNVRLKDSGIIWIGAIPEHWQTIKNRYIFDKHKSLVGDKWETTQLLSLTKSGIVEKDIDEGGGKQPQSFSTYQFVEKGDLILCLFDLDCSAVFSGLSGFDGMISPAYKRYTCKDGVYNGYFKYFFDAAFTGRHYKLYSKSLRYTIDDDIFDSLYSILPPIEEQKEIAEYLNKKCAEIDDVIGDKEEQLDVLESYKKSLIFEVVTGKKGAK